MSETCYLAFNFAEDPDSLVVLDFSDEAQARREARQLFDDGAARVRVFDSSGTIWVRERRVPTRCESAHRKAT